ncbi:hypothetical protein GETHPA_10640 [Geothrix rubra]|uniref:DUF4412 domain-containing protein n=1 Tax=Geothrix rubra TaxID=2927977 RepID=A0ABQ5Q559_9BACT|nr:DUF4412 domain-containing protein [Geothrix rubra]GLH69531.1 hypothetical protein GETHPA_10640 [Geothrix rubra]
MRRLTLVALSAILAGFSLLGGDLTITSHVTGKGRFAKEGTQVQYVDATRMRMNQEGARTDTLVDYGHEVFYTIDHTKKVVTKVTFKDMQEAMQAMEDQMAAMPEMVTRMMFGDTTEVKVEQLGADSVLGRPCRKVRVSIGKMVEELSLDPSLQFPIRDYAKAMSMMNRMPGGMGAMFKRLYQAIGQLKGVPLRTHVTGLMGMDMTTEATAVSTAPIPGSVWALPAGYKEVDGGKEMKESMKGRH